MWDHIQLAHSEQTSLDPANVFKFSLVSGHRDPLERQIMEAIRIEKSFTGVMTNSKGQQFPVVSLNRRGEHFAPRERDWSQ